MGQKTPIENAYNTYRKIRREGFSKLSRDERLWYFTYRSLRNYTKYWRRRIKNSLLEQAETSLESTKTWVEEWEKLETWLNNLIPTEELFTRANGNIDINSDIVYLHNGATATVPKGWRHKYNSTVRILNLLRNEITENIDTAREQIELVEDNENPEDLLESIKDEIRMAAFTGGLEEVEEKNNRDDGALWFVDPETDTEYYYLLGIFNPRFNPYEILYKFAINKRDNWKYHPWIPLNRSGLETSGGKNPRMDTVGNRCGPRQLRSIEYILDSAKEPAPRALPWANRIS